MHKKKILWHTGSKKQKFQFKQCIKIKMFIWHTGSKKQKFHLVNFINCMQLIIKLIDCNCVLGLYEYSKRVCAESWLFSPGEKSFAPTGGIEPASALHLAFQSEALPTELPHPPDPFPHPDPFPQSIILSLFNGLLAASFFKCLERLVTATLKLLPAMDIWNLNDCPTTLTRLNSPMLVVLTGDPRNPM